MLARRAWLFPSVRTTTVPFSTISSSVCSRAPRQHARPSWLITRTPSTRTEAAGTRARNAKTKCSTPKTRSIGLRKKSKGRRWRTQGQETQRRNALRQKLDQLVYGKKAKTKCSKLDKDQKRIAKTKWSTLKTRSIGLRKERKDKMH